MDITDIPPNITVEYFIDDFVWRRALQGQTTTSLVVPPALYWRLWEESHPTIANDRDRLALQVMTIIGPVLVYPDLHIHGNG